MLRGGLLGGGAVALLFGGGGGVGLARQAYLRQQAFDLSQALADLGAVLGGDVVEGKG